MAAADGCWQHKHDCVCPLHRVRTELEETFHCQRENEMSRIGAQVEQHVRRRRSIGVCVCVSPIKEKPHVLWGSYKRSPLLETQNCSMRPLWRNIFALNAPYGRGKNDAPQSLMERSGNVAEARLYLAVP